MFYIFSMKAGYSGSSKIWNAFELLHTFCLMLNPHVFTANSHENERESISSELRVQTFDCPGILEVNCDSPVLDSEPYRITWLPSWSLRSFGSLQKKKKKKATAKAPWTNRRRTTCQCECVSVCQLTFSPSSPGGPTGPGFPRSP